MFSDLIRDNGSKQPFLLLILLCISIILLDGFSVVNWYSFFPVNFHRYAAIILLLLYIFVFKNIASVTHFGHIVSLLSFYPFLSCINTHYIYQQDYYDTITALLPNLYWLLYFVLHYYKVKESTILKLFAYIAIIIVSIQIIQQFTYPSAIFGVYDENTMAEKGRDLAEVRNGLYRFRMGNNGYFTIPILFFLWTHYKVKNNFRIIFLISFFFISIYLTLTRQVIFACLIAFLCSFFMTGKGRNNKMAIIGLIFIIILYEFTDVLFGEFIESTSNDVNEDNIRYVTYSFYWGKAITDLPTFLFGNGVPAGNGYFQHLMSYWNEMGLYVVDIGIVGYIFQYGIIYILLFVYAIFNMFKYRNTIAIYLKCFMLFSVIMSPMIFPFTRHCYYFVWTLILYLADLYINKSDLLLQNNEDY